MSAVPTDGANTGRVYSHGNWQHCLPNTGHFYGNFDTSFNTHLRHLLRGSSDSFLKEYTKIVVVSSVERTSTITFLYHFYTKHASLDKQYNVNADRVYMCQKDRLIKILALNCSISNQQKGCLLERVISQSLQFKVSCLTPTSKQNHHEAQIYVTYRPNLLFPDLFYFKLQKRNQQKHERLL